MTSFKYSVARLIEAAIRPAIVRICYGREVPLGVEEWKRVAFSWSQFGEDLIANGILEVRGMSQEPMAYVDVGAYHPVQFSNTLFFKMRGWRGINIDPNPDTIDLFKKYRPNDQNVLCAVGPERSDAEFHIYSKRGVCATGRLSAGNARDSSLLGETAERTIPVRVRRLDSILEDSDFESRRFGLLSVDVEGCELGVLESNCWRRFRPMIVAVEEHPTSDTVITPFLNGKGYQLAGQCSITKLFIDQMSLEQ